LVYPFNPKVYEIHTLFSLICAENWHNPFVLNRLRNHIATCYNWLQESSRTSSPEWQMKIVIESLGRFERSIAANGIQTGMDSTQEWRSFMSQPYPVTVILIHTGDR
jgi:hypothetical protein